MICFAIRSLAVGLLLAQPAFAGEVDGTVSSRLDFYPDHADGTASQGRSVEVKIDAFHDFEDSRIVAELIVRADEKDSGRRITEARQAYIRTPLAGFDIFLGNRQEFWGKAESKNVVDVINQSDAAANDGKSGKLGAPSISAERYLDIGDLQLWYITGFREKTFNDSDAHPSSGLPVGIAQYARKDGKDADDFAARLTSFVGDWDIAGSIFYGTARDPILSVASGGSALSPYYALQKSVGLEAQYTGDATLLKWESLHGTQSSLQGSHDFAAAVAGIEYTYFGPFETVWDIGLIGEIQHDDRPQSAANQFGVAGVRLVFNDVADSNILFLASADRKADQSFVSFEASRRINDFTNVKLTSQFYNARTASSAFGLLSDDDAVTLTLNMFF
ncbi:MAG: hypothetical protein HOH48_04730 [Candidatus Puniceispirillum sp.]|jgi:hypothetical protein|uniref:hypothetical protein n=1 Tax=Candidatus Puniceispirillum sp. TaxID=2026719 RepID=UPI001EB28AD3|nr:hypothetical protein [Candidatus Puniceispirillum sp.]MBT6416615.1 hypothetical protein [Candidatus Puniceispirillum sp.]